MASEAVEDSSADDSVKCIRSDGLIVEGKNEGCFHKIQDEHGFGIIMLRHLKFLLHIQLFNPRGDRSVEVGKAISGHQRA